MPYSSQPALGVKNGVLLEARFRTTVVSKRKAALRAMDISKNAKLEVV
jgi:hypothetical protein